MPSVLRCNSCGTVYSDPGGLPHTYVCPSCRRSDFVRVQSPPTGSTEDSTAAGGVAGAALGAMLGGLPGALIGGLVGLIIASKANTGGGHS